MSSTNLPHVPGADVEIGRLTPPEEAAWDAFVHNHPRGSFYHRLQWIRMVEVLFRVEVHLWVARCGGGKILGVLPGMRLRSRLFGDFMVSLPYVNYGGALGRDGVVEESLMDFASADAGRLGSSHFEFRDTQARSGRWQVRTEKVSMRLALPSDPDLLWSDLGSKLRAQIKRSSREGATVKEGGVELLGDFYHVYSRNMRDLGTPVYARAFFEKILQAFPREATIIVVWVGAKPAAAGFLISNRGCMEIPWASSLREFNPIGVNMLLYWEALKRSIVAQHTEFDFGRSTKDGGTYRFKSQWGAEAVPLYWHYWLCSGSVLPALNPSNPKFKLAISAWRRMPLSLTRLLGPAIVKHLP